MKNGFRILTLLAVLLTGTALGVNDLQASSWERGELEIDLWLNRSDGSVYRQGQDVEIRFQVDTDCYVAVYNVDTEGFVHLLFPKGGDRRYVESEHTYHIPSSYDEYDLVVNGPRGIEYVVAVASPYPLNLDIFNPMYDAGYADHFAYSGRIVGDPSQAIWDLNDRLVWASDEGHNPGYSSDVGWFYVRERVPYPRYLVYDWWPDNHHDHYWDPYGPSVIFIDFHWDHTWCHTGWWWRGHRPSHHYWFSDHRGNTKRRWKSNFYHHTDKGHDLYRVKAPRHTSREKRSSRYRKDGKGSWNPDSKGERVVRDPGRRVESDSKRQRPPRVNSDRDTKPQREYRERDTKPRRENRDRDTKPHREQRVERERREAPAGDHRREQVKPKREEKREEPRREKPPTPKRDKKRQEKPKPKPKPKSDERATRGG